MSSESHHHSGAPTTTASEPDQGAGPGYEVRDTNVRSIVTFEVGLFVCLIGHPVRLWEPAQSDRRPATEEAPPTSPSPNRPRPGRTYDQGRKVTPEVSSSKSAITWDARKAVRIPIDEAIERIARNGLRPANGPARTEVEVNSHAGVAAPVTEPKKDEPAPSRKGGTP